MQLTKLFVFCFSVFFRRVFVVVIYCVNVKCMTFICIYCSIPKKALKRLCRGECTLCSSDILLGYKKFFLSVPASQRRLHYQNVIFVFFLLESGDCDNCGNTTEATTLLQQFFKKKNYSGAHSTNTTKFSKFKKCSVSSIYTANP